ncbi:MAG: hypothetical protein AAFR87_28875 [Bacteroidota bacterium]
MNRYLLILSFLLLLACKSSGDAKTSLNNDHGLSTDQTEFVVAYYNVENLFDTEDNPDKIDEDFTPGGRYEWDQSKYERKLFQISKAIKSIGPEGPDLLGLGEVENAKVIQDLLNQEPLKNRNYKFVHYESPDMRGIDVAFVYDSKLFKLSDDEAYEIYFKQEPDYTSRKVLHVKGKFVNQKLHVLVNHWPSRRGGQQESEFRRVAVAEEVRGVIDGIYAKDKDAHVIVMGDMNDDPFNKSIVETLGAVGKMDALEENGLFNPMTKLHDADNYGSLTYRGKWNLFDQIIMSEDLLDEKGKLKYVAGSAKVHNVELLQVGFGRGAKYPRRAIFRGQFEGAGYSDHFPVYVKLKMK